MSGLRIAIVAHGRFHAFDLARELERLGHDVSVFGNYPTWAVERFGLRRSGYRGLPAHGAFDRALRRAAPALLPATEAFRHRWFGQWAARALVGQAWDIVHGWSGVSEELLRQPIDARSRVLMRGSAHIAEQADLLAAEAARTGVAIDRPSPWMIDREEREYAHADRIVVLSEFARASFERRGVPRERLTVVPLGVAVDSFRVTPPVVQTRIARLLDGQPIRVLFVGALSAQKGLADFVTVARACADLPMTFTLVGPSLPETSRLLARGGSNITVLPARDQAHLPAVYDAADVFFFPTIQDGFGMVLAQAAAAGLVLLATTHCAAPEILAGGAQGWTVPARAVDAMTTRLRWCHDHRSALADRVRQAAVPARLRGWDDVAAAFIAEAGTWMRAGEARGRD